MKEKPEDITLALADGHGESCAIDGMGKLYRWKQPLKKGKTPERAEPTKLSVTAGVARQLRASSMFDVTPEHRPLLGAARGMRRAHEAKEKS